MAELIGRANAAHTAKEAAADAIVEAEATKEAAEDVSNKLNALDMKTFITNRFRRQDASTPATTYPTPVNCDNLKSTMTDLTNAVDYSSPDYDPTEATDIVVILTSLDISDLSPGCSTSRTRALLKTNRQLPLASPR